MKVNTKLEADHSQKQKNSSRSTTPGLFGGNPITGEGYNDKMKFGKKPAGNQASEAIISHSRI
jgi:hypothetical protein